MRSTAFWTGASSIYHSLQIKAEQRSYKGLSYLLSYTWSKALDNGSGLFPSDNPDVSSSFRLQNLYNMRGERALPTARPESQPRRDQMPACAVHERTVVVELPVD